MPITPPGTWPRHYLLAFGGIFYGSEIWNCTMRFMDPVDRSDEDMVAQCPDFLSHAKTCVYNWLMGAANGLSTAAGLQWIKFNALDTAGHYISQQDTFADAWSPVQYGGMGAWAQKGACPPDTALAITFHTQYRGPRRAHGRLYLPPQLPTITAGGRIASDALTAVANGAQNFVNAINDAPGFEGGTGPRLAVVSKKSERFGTPPVATEVNEVWVGDVLDTQRRRGNKLREVFTTRAIDTSEAL